MRRAGFVAAALAVLACAPASAGEAARIEYASPEAAIAALRAMPGVEFREDRGWIVVREPKAGGDVAFWSFTTDANRAHPSVVKRVVVEIDGSLYMDMDVLCGADQATCDEMVQVFVENDRQLIDKARGG